MGASRSYQLSVGQTALNMSHQLTGDLQRGRLINVFPKWVKSCVHETYMSKHTCKTTSAIGTRGRKHAPDQSLSGESRCSHRKAKPPMTN